MEFPVERLQIAHFELLPKGHYGIKRWEAREALCTRFARFTFEVVTELEDDAPPDQELVDALQLVADFIEFNEGAVLDKIYEHYSIYSRDTDWLGYVQVPADLTRERLSPFIRGTTVEVHRGDPKAFISIGVYWDEEHGINLEIADGKVEFYEL